MFEKNAVLDRQEKTEGAENRPPVISINGQTIIGSRNEDILSAALQEGLDFPHSCRVGGCAACKCRLIEGKVKELTETGYLLTEEELNSGYILACQSIPETDLKIELENEPPQKYFGKIIGQKKLNHDICEISIQLDRSIRYKAGQYASLSLEGLPGIERNYSFASPVEDGNTVNFFIKKMPDGKFSSYVHENSLIGKSVQLKGPYGEFWLRPGKNHILMMAGGSGLAPILAILRQALKDRTYRPVTLLFGAKKQEDLYRLEEIRNIQKQWPTEFNFIPVLSEEDENSLWNGARGFASDIIYNFIESGSEAYLCGPPPMVNSARDLLIRNGVSRKSIYADPFTVGTGRTDESKGEEKKGTAGFFHYFKYSLFHIIGLLAAFTILAGGNYTVFGLIGLLMLYILGDAVSGNDITVPEYKYPKILTFQLWMALPLLMFIIFSSVWSVSSTDSFGFGAWAGKLTGYDFLQAREISGWIHHFCGFITAGLMIGLVGTITAHELTHRTWDPASMFIGRWLLAFSFDTIFSIEHVYGHHRYVSTVEDPATAPRGRNVYYHIISSSIKGNISAWKIEASRLRKKHLPVISVHNAFLRGHLMSVFLVFMAWITGGMEGMLFFTACAVWGKALLEIVNYMEHYGMVRLPEEPVQPRHSWNTNRRVSSWTMFNLTRHSHHHAQGEVPYHKLRPYPEAPMMINGYLTTIVIALIPPLWTRLMIPKVIEWDTKYASPEEQELIKAANRKSGIPELMKR